MSCPHHDATKFEHLRPQLTCARCGAHLCMPSWSEYVDEHHVRHLWQCDTCGSAFGTIASYEVVAA